MPGLPAPGHAAVFLAAAETQPGPPAEQPMCPGFVGRVLEREDLQQQTVAMGS